LCFPGSNRPEYTQVPRTRLDALLEENEQLKGQVEELEKELQSGVVKAQEELEMVCHICGDKIFVPEGLPLVLPGPGLDDPE
jgi:hypothetical protein